MIKRKRSIYVLSLFFIGLALLLVPDMIVRRSCRGLLFTSEEEVPHNKAGLLLGTSKYTGRGRLNLYYKYRIDAAVSLYKAGKIDYILVSGDNSRKSYDEPTEMKNDLVNAGVPAGKIFPDYAGFRTLDSVVRCREIFSQDSITVISQRFHNERAVFIAKHKGITAVGFNARDVTRSYGAKTRAREKLARVKMLADLVFGKKPKFLGEKVEIR